MPSEDKSEGTGMKTIGVLIVGLIVGILIGAAIGAIVFPQSKTQSIGAANELKAGEAGENLIEFLTDYVATPGVDVELINTTEVELYKIAVNVSSQGVSKEVVSYITKDGGLWFPEVVDIEDFKEMVDLQKREAENRSRALQQQEQNTTIGNFIVSADEICMEDEKTIIYFFGSDACGHCNWEHPVIVNVTSNFEGYISFHDNMNSDEDSEIFSKYSTGGVPTLVFGCKYYRVGSGAGMGKEQESKVLTALICDLTGNKPADVCSAPEIKALLAQL